MFLPIALLLLFLSQSVHSTQICTAVNYSGIVYETDGLWNPTNLAYSYNFNLAIVPNFGNSTFPNILQVTSFADYSSNSSIYYRSSTFNFIINTPDGLSNETVVCQLSGGACSVASTNGIATNTFDLNYLTVTDYTNIFVQNGGIYNGNSQNPVNPNLCLMGKSDTISSQHYYKYNQTACCSQYIEVTTEAPNYTTTVTPSLPSDGYGTQCSDNAKLAWLDIVLVIDVSNVMTKIQTLFASITTVMQRLSIGQGSDHTTRIGIITYATNITTVMELRDTTTYDDFEDTIFSITTNDNDEGGNMGAALSQSFNHLLAQKSYRKPVIILASAAFNAAGFKDVNATANSIKENGITIMVINYAESDLVLTGALKGLASDGYYYVSDDDNLIPSMTTGLTQINCYCPATTIQLKLLDQQYLNYTKYANCLTAVIDPASPSTANKRVCNPGSLVSLTSQAKFDFVIDNFFTSGNPLFGEKKFSIGLHKSAADGTWKWWGYNGTEIAYDNFPPFVQTPAADDNYGYMWNYQGFLWKLQTGDNTVLKYICEKPACDAANVCKK